MNQPSGDSTGKPENPQFRKVAECLYRHESSNIYYALVKRSGKQYRRSLKNTDRKLAERKLSDFREKVGQLSHTASAGQITSAALAARWLESLKPTLKPSSYSRRVVSIAQITPYLGSLTLRQITSRSCEEWASKRSPEISASYLDLQRLRHRFLMVLPLVLLLVGTGAWWLAKRALTPVATLIRVTLRPEAGVATIAVGNTGPGIPEPDRPRVFERFCRSDPARRRDRAAGAGLGLSVSREILRAHGGGLILDRNESDWTEFVAKLPLQT